MCARFLTPATAQAAAERYWKTVKPFWEFAASWRVLPTQQIPIVFAIDGATTGPTSSLVAVKKRTSFGLLGPPDLRRGGHMGPPARGGRDGG